MQKIAKIFQNGGSQAIRLPAEFRFEGNEVIIEQVGNALLVKPAKPDWDEFFDDPTTVPEDFLVDREDPPAQERDLF